MPHVLLDARHEDIRVAALERRGLGQVAQRMALRVILAQEQRIDPRRLSAHDHLLVVVREDLRHDEIRAAEKVRQRARLAYVFQRVTLERLKIMQVTPLDFLAFEIGARGRVRVTPGGQAEMPCGVL